MSGGGIGKQTGEDDRQIVIFTFSGTLDGQKVDDWNKSIGDFLTAFEGHLTGVTLKDVGGVNPRRKPKP
jgi:hypothetical protein